MRINFTARHSKVPTRVKEYAENEVQRLAKIYDGIVDCQIVVDQEKAFHTVEINVMVYGNQLNVKNRGNDIYKTIDEAVDKVERQLIKYKEKLHRHPHESKTRSL